MHDFVAKMNATTNSQLSSQMKKDLAASMYIFFLSTFVTLTLFFTDEAQHSHDHPLALDNMQHMQ